MLPSRMQTSKTVEEQLKRLKIKTGVTPNVSARLAFFKSVEAGFRYDPSTDYKTDGQLTLDKVTWLGKTQQVTELLLEITYPELNSKQLQKAWAAHVDSGISSLRNVRSLEKLIEKL